MRTAEEWWPKWPAGINQQHDFIRAIQADAWTAGRDAAAACAERHPCFGNRYLDYNCQTRIVNAIRALRGGEKCSE